MGRHRGVQMTPPTTQGTEKDPEKVTLEGLRDDFWWQNDDIGTLPKHCYLLHFQAKIQLWDHPMPSGMQAYANFSAWLAI